MSFLISTQPGKGMKKPFFFGFHWLFLVILSISLIGCGGGGGGGESTDSGGGDTGTDPGGTLPLPTTSTLLQGLVLGSSPSQNISLKSFSSLKSSEQSFSTQSSYSHLRSANVAPPVNLLEDNLSNCQATAYDAKTDKEIATVNVAADGTYAFTSAQINLGTTYKVGVKCNNGTIEMSSYATSAASLPGTTADIPTADINPKSTAIAAYVKKALVKTITKAIATGEGTNAEKKEKALELIGPLVQSISTIIQKKIDTGAMEIPATAAAVTILEKSVNGTPLSGIDSDADKSAFESAFDQVITENAADWEIPPTMDGELEGAAAQGAANAACQVGATDAGSIKTCARTLSEFLILGLNWPIVIPFDGSDSKKHFWGITSCDQAGFGFDDVLVKYKVGESGNCVINSRIRQEYRNGDDGRSGGDMKFGAGLIHALAANMKKGTNYSMQDINNMIFKKVGSGDSQIGWGWMIMADADGGNRYAYDQTFGFSKINFSNCTDQGCDWPENLNVTTPSDIFFRSFGGTVPSKENLEKSIYNTKTYIRENTFESENWVLINESLKRGRNDDGSTNYCEDNNPSTICTTISGDSVDNHKITVGVSFEKFTGGQAVASRVGFRYITGLSDAYSTVTKNEKNFYLEPVWDRNGATGAFSLINAKTGYRLHNAWGQEVIISLIRSEKWCDSDTARFGNLSCTTNEVGDVVEFWTSWEQDASSDKYKRAYNTPGNTVSFVPVTGSIATDLLNSQMYNFKHGEEKEYTFRCEDNSKLDKCQGGSTDEYPTTMRPLAYGDWNDLQNVQFAITTTNGQIDVSADVMSGSYYAEQEWNCTGSNCTQSFYFYKLDSSSTNIEILTTETVSEQGQTNFGKNVYSISDSSMDILLTAANLPNAVDYHYFMGPVANASWSAEKDPWSLTGVNNSSITFSSTWKMREWVTKPVNWGAEDLSAADFKARCSYYKDSTPDSVSYQALCESLQARNLMQEAIENLRWGAIDWDQFTGSDEGPFSPISDSSLVLRQKWDVLNYAQQALWNYDLGNTERANRCNAFSDMDSLRSDCQAAVTASTISETFFNKMEGKCWGQWNEDNQQWTAPTLSVEQCINSSIDFGSGSWTDSSGWTDQPGSTWEDWKKWDLLHLGAQAVWDHSMDRDQRVNRCNLLTDSTSDAWAGGDSLQTLCVNAVNSGQTMQDFQTAMSNFTEGPFVDWSQVDSTGDSQEWWNKTYWLTASGNDPTDGLIEAGDVSSDSYGNEFRWKGSIGHYLEEIQWNWYNAEWNPSGLQANDITDRCQFFRNDLFAADGTSLNQVCQDIALAVTARNTFDDIRKNGHSEFPSFINWDDSRISRRSDNGYLYEDPESALNVYSFAFPGETFDGKHTWTQSTNFNALQAFSLIFHFFEGESKDPLGISSLSSSEFGNFNWGDLDVDNYSDNQKKWLSYEIYGPGDEQNFFAPLSKAFNSPEALR
ncbi:MAG: hypothetical protein COB67_02815 [SAR324 cluster bacterium]|uniref:Uncharacterized protein n=1 Tax=SAR324 cluster bacterium TaxID=2024889 RepID=A0A2A4T8Q5_9DELT|nr:MAG: hypothetical protein COB67_02815 [SAR324 cluster bacterium]